MTSSATRGSEKDIAEYRGKRIDAIDAAIRFAGGKAPARYH